MTLFSLHKEYISCLHIVYTTTVTLNFKKCIHNSFILLKDTKNNVFSYYFMILGFSNYIYIQLTLPPLILSILKILNTLSEDIEE